MGAKHFCGTNCPPCPNKIAGYTLVNTISYFFFVFLQLGVAPLADNNPRHKYLYEIVVLTGQRHGAGTDSKVCPLYPIRSMRLKELVSIAISYGLEFDSCLDETFVFRD